MKMLLLFQTRSHYRVNMSKQKMLSIEESFGRHCSTCILSAVMNRER